jgi:orotate phosphoribosyltransferase
MTESEIKAIFQECGALLSGHFLLSSGNHSDAYLEKFRIFEQPVIHSRLISELLQHFAGSKIDLVMGPALGGVIMASEAARQLGARAVYAEKEGGKLTLRRGFKLDPQERVLIVDDIVTTGGSVRETLEIARNTKVNIIGIAVLADRSGGKVDFGIKHTALLKLDLPIFSPEKCPLCAKQMALIKPGSR